MTTVFSLSFLFLLRFGARIVGAGPLHGEKDATFFLLNLAFNELQYLLALREAKKKQPLPLSHGCKNVTPHPRRPSHPLNSWHPRPCLCPRWGRPQFHRACFEIPITLTLFSVLKEAPPHTSRIQGHTSTRDALFSQPVSVLWWMVFAIHSPYAQ